REKVAQQRQREKAVGDRGAVGRLGPRPVCVAVDPLPILGHLGEGVDPLLREGEPVADADFLADEPPEFQGAVNDALRHTDLPGVELLAHSRPRLVEHIGRSPGSQDPWDERNHTMTSYEHILYDVADGVATVTLNRPDKLNAWTAQMEKEVQAAMAQAEADDQVRVVILTGAGRGFCAGADLQDLGKVAGASSAADLDRILQDRFVGPQRADARADFQ